MTVILGVMTGGLGIMIQECMAYGGQQLIGIFLELRDPLLICTHHSIKGAVLKIVVPAYVV